MYKNLKSILFEIWSWYLYGKDILMEIFSGNFLIELGNCNIGYILLVYDSD